MIEFARVLLNLPVSSLCGPADNPIDVDRRQNVSRHFRKWLEPNPEWVPSQSPRRHSLTFPRVGGNTLCSRIGRCPAMQPRWGWPLLGCDIPGRCPGLWELNPIGIPGGDDCFPCTPWLAAGSNLIPFIFTTDTIDIHCINSVSCAFQGRQPALALRAGICWAGTGGPIWRRRGNAAIGWLGIDRFAAIGVHTCCPVTTRSVQL